MHLPAVAVVDDILNTSRDSHRVLLFPSEKVKQRETGSYRGEQRIVSWQKGRLGFRARRFSPKFKRAWVRKRPLLPRLLISSTA